MSETEMRRLVSGHFELGVPAVEAMEFFTPEGERDWVPGWSPVYATLEPSESPGAVFTTEVHGVSTIWLILEIDRVGCTAAYARVTPGRHAGTVQVRCADAETGGCVVSVTYDMSLLPGTDPKWLDAYDDAKFEAMMNDWTTAVSTVLDR